MHPLWELGELVFDRASLLLPDLCLEKIGDDVLRLLLALDDGGHERPSSNNLGLLAARSNGGSGASVD
jgi:hypothetical protein